MSRTETQIAALPSGSEYLAETFAPGADPGQVRRDSERIDEAISALAESGEVVRHLCTLLVPDEETTFHFFEASEPGVVAQVLRAAGIEADRISRVVQARSELVSQPREASFPPDSRSPGNHSSS